MNTDERMVSGFGYPTGKEIVKIRMAAQVKGLATEDMTCLRDFKLVRTV